MNLEHCAHCENSERCEHSENAANLAVKKVFYLVGVDVENAESVEAFREDLRFGRKIRKLADHGLLAVVALIALGIISVFWSGFLTVVKR